MFGVIVSGRAVQTNFEQISPTQFLITIPDANNINHIVIFLTGSVLFPEGTAGQIFFSWPDPNAPPNWQILGKISNDKPSTIFKISNIKKLHEIGDYSNMKFGQSHIVHNAQVGVSIESIANIQEIVSQNNPLTNLTFAQKMLENFMNYIMSYATTAPQLNVLSQGINYVPLNTVQNWYSVFERRLKQNPNFWKS